MKTYFEQGINPETKKEEEIEVNEYYFDDWEKGIISGNIEPGKDLVYHKSEKRYIYKSLSYKEYSKIETEREKIYFEKVEEQSQNYIEKFQLRYESSGNKERHLQTEIEYIEKQLFPENFPTVNRSNIPFGLQLRIDRKLYQKIIVNGERDFTLTNSPKCKFQFGGGDVYYISIEAIARFYNYLKELAGFPQQPQETGQNEKIISDIPLSFKSHPLGHNNTDSLKYEKSIRVIKKATKENAELIGIKIGEKYSMIPDPKNKNELFERFEKLHAQRYFETLQRLFFKKYGDGNEKIFTDELNELNIFITKTESLSTTETFKNKFASSSSLGNLHEYSRLENSFYKNKDFVNSVYSFFNSNAAEVYGRYFLYKEWLDEQLKHIKGNISKPQLAEQNHDQKNVYQDVNSIKKKPNQENEIWTSEYELRQFIDVALRWSINAVFSSITKHQPYSVFTYEIEHARENYDKFCIQLREKLSQLPPQQWKAIEIDLSSRFITGIDLYLEWYDKNKDKTKKFEPYNPYEMMFEIIISTKKEILKYFPSLIPLQSNQLTYEKNSNIEKKNSIDEIEIILNEGVHEAILYDYYSIVKQKFDIHTCIRDKNIGKLNQPFSFWNGIYFHAPNRLSLSSTINSKILILNEKIITDESQLQEHLENYIIGFKEGYNEFEKKHISPKISLFKDPENISKHIYNYAVNHKIRNNGGIFYKSRPLDEESLLSPNLLDKYVKPYSKILPIDISECHKNQDDGLCSLRLLYHQERALVNRGLKVCESCTQWEILPLKRWKAFGKEAGYYYRTWYVILANSELFAKYVKANEDNTPPPSEKILKNIGNSISVKSINEISDELKSIERILNFKKGKSGENENKVLIRKIIQTCRENLMGVEHFGKSEYAALYLIIYDKNHILFKPKPTDKRILQEFDKIFSTDTAKSQKRNKVIMLMDNIKIKYPWIDNI